LDPPTVTKERSMHVIMLILLYRPTLQEIKREVLLGKGGTCYVISVFAHNLLEVLGFKVCYSAVAVLGNLSHVALIVNDVQIPGDRFFVDVATGYPYFEPVSLDFKIESKVYSHTWLQYKFVMEEDRNIISRWHLSKRGDDDPMGIDSEKHSNWKKFFVIDTTPRSLDYIHSFIDEVYTDSKGEITPIFIKFIFSGCKVPTSVPVMMKDTSILRVTDSNAIESNIANSVEDMVKIFEEYYPALKDDVFEAAKHLNLFPSS